MQRRILLQTVGLGGAAAVAAPLKVSAAAAPPPVRITRVRFDQAPNFPGHFNQSFDIVTLETDLASRTSGEGGCRNTISQCAGMIIGEDLCRIEHLW
jgi:hypothetical protein